MNYRTKTISREQFFLEFHDVPDTRANFETFFKECGYALTASYRTHDKQQLCFIRSELIFHDKRSFYKVTDSQWKGKTSYFSTLEYKLAAMYVMLLIMTAHRDFIYPDPIHRPFSEEESVFGVSIRSLLRSSIEEVKIEERKDILDYLTISYLNGTDYDCDLQDQNSRTDLEHWLLEGNAVRICRKRDASKRPTELFIGTSISSVAGVTTKNFAVVQRTVGATGIGSDTIEYLYQSYPELYGSELEAKSVLGIANRLVIHGE